MTAVSTPASRTTGDVPGVWLNTPGARAWRVRAIGVLGLFVVGLLDYYTGAEISFSIFYIPAVAYVAWAAGVRSATVIAALGAAVWLSVELLTQPPFAHPLIPVWNAAARAAVFMGAVVTVRLMRNQQSRLRSVVADRTRKLRAEAAQRRAIEREMVELAAQQQARMARDLHDGVGQYLSGLAFRADMLAEDLRRANSPHAEQAARLLDMIAAANRETRRLNHLLQVRGETEDLAAALRRLVDDIHHLFDIPCDVELPDRPVELAALKTDTLYRLAQEALNNAVKHARATRICLSLARTGPDWRLTISDQGSGLPADAAVNGGAGLKIMRYRAELIGGRLTIGNAPTGGCTVECVFPDEQPGDRRA